MSDRLRTREWSGVDYYAELGITSGASRAAIDEAYRRRAKALHPDTNPDPTAEDRFKRLTGAYEVLRDPVTRQAYDDFRYRVDAGLLYAPRPGQGPGDALRRRPEPPPSPRRRKARTPMPAGLRLAIGWFLLAAAGATVAWALLGDLPSHTAGDTARAVQITLLIMAAKLVAGGVIVLCYPRLRARWHREPGAG